MGFYIQKAGIPVSPGMATHEIDRMEYGMVWYKSRRRPASLFRGGRDSFVPGVRNTALDEVLPVAEICRRARDRSFSVSGNDQSLDSNVQFLYLGFFCTDLGHSYGSERG